MQYMYSGTFWGQFLVVFLGLRPTTNIDVFSSPQSILIICLFWECLVSIVISSVLLVFKLQDPYVSFRWWIVFVPVWISSQLCNYHATIFYIRRRNWQSRILLAMIVVTSFSLVAFSLLLLLHFHGTIQSLQFVFIPLWICLGMLPMVSLFSFLEQFISLRH
jgi:hypothetical protein